MNRNTVVPVDHENGYTIVEPLKDNSSTNTRVNCDHVTAGDETEIQQKCDPVTKLTKLTIFIRIGDLFFTTLIVFFVVAFWRGVWQIFDVISEQHECDPWLSIGIGYSIPFALYLFQEPLKKLINLKSLNYPTFYLISRLLLLTHAFGCVNQWRGFWVFLDIYTGVELDSAIGSLLIGVILSLVFKSFVNCLAPPLFLNLDESWTIHDCAIRFHTKPEKKMIYFLDCVWSVLIATTLVICSWRGLWALADLYLYPEPENETKSALVSLIIGIIGSFVLSIWQPITYRFLIRQKGLFRLAFAGLHNFLGFFVCVFCWRGIWNTLNIYLVFDGELTSEYITVGLGSIGCLLLGTISTIIVRGVSVDGEEFENGEWPISYITAAYTSPSPKLTVDNNDDNNKPDKSNNTDKSTLDPFPEPWILRLFCKSLKSNAKVSKREKKPLNQNGQKIESGTSHGAEANSTNSSAKYAMGFDKLKQYRLSQIPTIDGSDEEELGNERRSFLTPPEYVEPVNVLNDLQDQIKNVFNELRLRTTTAND